MKKITIIILIFITIFLILFRTNIHFDKKSDYSVFVIITKEFIAMPGSGGEYNVRMFLLNKYFIPISTTSFTNKLTGTYYDIKEGLFNWKGDCLYPGKFIKICK